MTQPHLQDCAHSPDGWCLTCVRDLNGRLVVAQQRLAAIDGADTQQSVMSAGIRAFPAVPARVETGSLQFGDDWPGIFIRGDDAAQFAMSLAAVFGHVKEPIAQAVLSGLHQTLASALIGPGGDLVRAALPTLPSLSREPTTKTVGRMGEMTPMGESAMLLHLQTDGDVVLSITNDPTGGEFNRCSLEFCGSGGHSPRTRAALIAAMVAVEDDYAATPERAWPRRRAARSGATTDPTELA